MEATVKDKGKQGNLGPDNKSPTYSESFELGFLEKRP
jgi:hypothetical protein